MKARAQETIGTEVKRGPAMKERECPSQNGKSCQRNSDFCGGIRYLGEEKPLLQDPQESLFSGGKSIGEGTGSKEMLEKKDQ